MKTSAIKSVNDILADPNWRDRWVEMVSTDHLGRRILVGFKRRSSRSRKKRVAFLTGIPIMLDTIVEEHERTKAKIAAEQTTD